MDCIDDQQPNFKHYCRVCKKGFICGRALGGHMRAHDIGYENESFDDDEDDDDDHGSDWEDKLGGSKRMYQLRTNPNRQKSCKNCENCGKEFLCWKSFLEHGKCSSNDVYEPPVSSGEDEGERRGLGWSKKKRTTRTKVGDISSNFPPNEDEDMLLARCLVQLANTIVEPMPWPEQSSSSGSREEERRNPRMFFRGSKAKGLPTPKGLFECKACKKVFNSHQALGGHRASHKKVKGCFAAKQDQYESNVANDDMITDDQFLFPSKPTSFEQGPALVGAAKRKSKVHECSICHRVFASGQALGGHKRCHWIVSNSSNASPLAKYQPEENMEPSHHHHEPRPTNFAISALDRDPPKHEYDDNNNNNSNVIIHKVEDEADSKSKLAKLSELKEMGSSENPSQWLQIGFGSGTEAAADV